MQSNGRKMENGSTSAILWSCLAPIPNICGATCYCLLLLPIPIHNICLFFPIMVLGCWVWVKELLLYKLFCGVDGCRLVIVCQEILQRFLVLLQAWLRKFALFAQCESHFKSIEKRVCLLCQLEPGTQAGQSRLGPDRAILWLSWLSSDSVMVDVGQPMQRQGHFA